MGSFPKKPAKCVTVNLHSSQDSQDSKLKEEKVQSEIEKFSHLFLNVNKTKVKSPKSHSQDSFVTWFPNVKEKRKSYLFKVSCPGLTQELKKLTVKKRGISIAAAAAMTQLPLFFQGGSDC